MTRYRVVYKEEAADDPAGIQDYLDEHQPDRADSVVDGLTAAIDLLEYLPKRNRVRFQRKTPGLSVYTLPVLSYIVYYRVIDDASEVSILTVRHISRQPRRRFPQ